VTLRTMRL